MTCNNAKADFKNGHYSLTIPDYLQEEKNAVLKEAIEKYSGFVHVEISRVRKPKSIEQLKLFHPLITIYYLSGKSSCKSWQGLKNDIKYRLGQGLEQTFDMPDGSKCGVLKSLANYSMKELAELNSNLIAEMLIQEVDSKKFFEILESIKYEVRT